MIDLNKEYIEFIKRTVAENLTGFRLYVFGSRAKDTARKYSDIDIAIDSTGLTPKVKSKLEFIFENSTIPYEVDIIDLNNISYKKKSPKALRIKNSWKYEKDLIQLLNLKSCAPSIPDSGYSRITRLENIGLAWRVTTGMASL